MEDSKIIFDPVTEKLKSIRPCSNEVKQSESVQRYGKTHLKHSTTIGECYYKWQGYSS